MSATSPTAHPPQRWHWPPRHLTLVVAAILLALGFLANFPAIQTYYFEPANQGGYFFHFEPTLEHGWPWRYSRRGRWNPPSKAPVRPERSRWTPWKDVEQFSTAALLLNVSLWSAAVLAVAACVQFWQTHRPPGWRVTLNEMLAATAAAGALCAVVAWHRIDHLHEQKLRQAMQARGAGAGDAFGAHARVPGWLPVIEHATYERAFERVVRMRSFGDSDLACQFPHLLVLAEQNPSREFPQHLASMPRLIGLECSHVQFPVFDATQRRTMLSSLPPLPRLLAIRLQKTNVTDGDLQWLARCPRLESVDLSDTNTSDRGLLELRPLSRLRALRLSSPRITDHGCRTLAEMQSLELLSLASRNISDAGVRDLARLRGLRELSITAAASPATFEELKRHLPDCKVHASAWRQTEEIE
jgi:hypothetical protein